MDKSLHLGSHYPVRRKQTPRPQYFVETKGRCTYCTSKGLAKALVAGVSSSVGRRFIPVGSTHRDLARAHHGEQSMCLIFSTGPRRPRSCAWDSSTSRQVQVNSVEVSFAFWARWEEHGVSSQWVYNEISSSSQNQPRFITLPHPSELCDTPPETFHYCSITVMLF